MKISVPPRKVPSCYSLVVKNVFLVLIEVLLASMLVSPTSLAWLTVLTVLLYLLHLLPDFVKTQRNLIGEGIQRPNENVFYRSLAKWKLQKRNLCDLILKTKI